MFFNICYLYIPIRYIKSIRPPHHQLTASVAIKRKPKLADLSGGSVYTTPTNSPELPSTNFFTNCDYLYYIALANNTSITRNNYWQCYNEENR